MNLILKNKNDQIIDLINNKDRFIITAADALHGIESSIGENDSPYMDGTTIDSVKALPRGIELTFKIKDDVEENLAFIKSFIKSKQYVTLIENDKEIKGIATINYHTRLSQSCELKLSIYCGQPYWEDIDYIISEITQYINLLFFPEDGQYFTYVGRPFGAIDNSHTKTFVNDGDVSIGMIFNITALGSITNPRISCSSGEQNGWYMQLNLTLNDGDEVEICTIKGSKYILINGSQYILGNNPILSYLAFDGDDWLQLEQGSNTFNVTATSGQDNIFFNISYKRRYE